MSLVSMSPSEYLITGLFEVNNMQSGISLLIFLDCMHSKLPIFWNLVKKLTFLLPFLLLSKGLMKVNWVTKGELLRVVIKVGYKMSISSAQLLRFSISMIPCNDNQCPWYCPWSIVRSSWQDELSLSASTVDARHSGNWLPFDGLELVGNRLRFISMYVLNLRLPKSPFHIWNPEFLCGT